MRIQNNLNGYQQQSSFKQNAFLPIEVFAKNELSLLNGIKISGKDEEGICQCLRLSRGYLFLDVKTEIGKKLADAKKFFANLPLGTAEERKLANQKADELLADAERIAQLPETVKIEA